MINSAPLTRALLLAALLPLSAHSLAAQGCVPARHFAISLGPDGTSYLQDGQWLASVSYRYLYAEDGWLGTDYDPAYATVIGNRVTIHSLDTQLTYALSTRWSLTATIPFVHGETSNPREHNGVRHDVTASGLGDIRLTATAWLLKPEDAPRANFALGLGIKAPTGNHDATDTFHRSNGPETLPVDISIQPGDGGWGTMIEFGGFREMHPRWVAYLNGYYLINPQGDNSAETNQAFPPTFQIQNLSVPDNYQLRSGVTWMASPRHGLALLGGVRIVGVPAHDLVGGDEGFRRPGYTVYVEPGLTWTMQKFAFQITVPIRVDANRTQNIYEEQAGTQGRGAFADSLLNISVSRIF